MKSFLLAFVAVTSFASAFAAETCELHPLLRSSDGAAVNCTNSEDGRRLNRNAEMPKVAVVKKLLEMGYTAKNDSTFIKP